MSDAEFWRITPAEFGALKKLRRTLQRETDYKLGTAVAWLCEPWRNRETRSEPFTAEDVFPWLKQGATEQRQPTEQATIIHRLQCLAALQERGRKR